MGLRVIEIKGRIISKKTYVKHPAGLSLRQYGVSTRCLPLRWRQNAVKLPLLHTEQQQRVNMLL